ncbi:MAG TPA: hypothetical protein VFN09_12450, partial [Rhodanobacteraceae bacterium]|nr:hypothetical protein [Rhodanobacteraceae bacterium]
MAPDLPQEPACRRSPFRNIRNPIASTLATESGDALRPGASAFFLVMSAENAPPRQHHLGGKTLSGQAASASICNEN